MSSGRSLGRRNGHILQCGFVLLVGILYSFLLNNILYPIYVNNKVNPCWFLSPPSSSQNTRTYYIGAVEEIWDYVPQGQDIFGGSIDSPESTLNVFTKKEDGKFIGKMIILKLSVAI